MQPEHNYKTKIAKMHADGLIPDAQLLHVGVAHDNWCEIYKGVLCNCNPDIILPSSLSAN